MWIELARIGYQGLVTEAHRQLKEINPAVSATIRAHGTRPIITWASTGPANSSIPTAFSDWATPEYRNTGYADLLDIYMTGTLLYVVTKAEVDKANGVVGQRTKRECPTSRIMVLHRGGAEWAKKITCGVVPVTGSIYVEQYEGDAAQFTRAVAQALRDTDGLMIFDIVHIINRGWWSELAAGIAEGSN